MVLSTYLIQEMSLLINQAGLEIFVLRLRTLWNLQRVRSESFLRSMTSARTNVLAWLKKVATGAFSLAEFGGLSFTSSVRVSQALYPPV